MTTRLYRVLFHMVAVATACELLSTPSLAAAPASHPASPTRPALTANCTPLPVGNLPVIVPQWPEFSVVSRIVVFSTDGSVVVTSDHSPELRVWDAKTGELRGVLAGHSRAPIFLAFSPVAPLLVTTSWDNSMRLWDLKTGGSSVLARFDARVDFAAFSPDGQTLAVPRSRDLSIIGLDGTVRATIPGKFSYATFSPNGRVVLSWGSGNGVTACDAASGAALWHTEPAGKFYFEHQATFSRDGAVVAWSRLDQQVNISDARTGRVREEIPLQDNAWSVAFSQDGTRLVVGLRRAIAIFDYPSLTKRGMIADISGDDLNFSRRANLIGTTNDRGLKLVDMSTGEAVQNWKENDNVSRAISPDGKTIAVLGSFYGGGLMLYDAATGAHRKFGTEQYGIYNLAWSPDGESIAATSMSELSEHENLVRIWDTRTGRVSKVLLDDNQQRMFPGYYEVAWSPRGDRVALSTLTDVTLWDPGNGRRRAILGDDSDSTSGHTLAYSPDGRELATSGGKHSEIRIWNPATGAKVRAFASGLSFVWSLAYSPDGTLLAAGGVGVVKVFDAAGRERETFKGSFRGSQRIVWLPKGSGILVGTQDASVVAFEFGSQQEKWAISLEKLAQIRSMDLNRSGTVLAIGTEEHGLELWDVTTRTKKADVPVMPVPVYSIAWHPWAPVFAAAGGAIELVRTDGATIMVRPVDLPRKKASLVYTPSGLYSGDPETFSKLRFRAGSDLIKSPLLRAEQVQNLYRPNLLAEFLGGCPVGH